MTREPGDLAGDSASRVTAGSREDHLSRRLDAETNKSPKANTDLENRFQEVTEAAELVPDGARVPSTGLRCAWAGPGQGAWLLAAPATRAGWRGWVGASGRPDLPVRSRRAGWGGWGLPLSSALSLCAAFRSLCSQMPRRVREGVVGAAGLGPSCGLLPAPPCPRPLALGRLVLLPLCPNSCFHEASPAARGQW